MKHKKMNGLQAALNLPCALVDVLGSTLGRHLEAATRKTQSGVVWKTDVAPKKVFGFLLSRQTLDLLYFMLRRNRRLTCKQEIIGQIIFYCLYLQFIQQEEYTVRVLIFNLLGVLAMSRLIGLLQ